MVHVDDVVCINFCNIFGKKAVKAIGYLLCFLLDTIVWQKFT